MYSYLNHFSALKILSLHFHCPVFLHGFLCACPQLESLQLFSECSVNHLTIFNSIISRESFHIQQTVGFSLKSLGVASEFVNQELFEYLFDRAGQLFELSINGRCLNSTMIHNVFNSLVNHERSFSTKSLNFDGSFIVSPELIAGINTNFHNLTRIKLGECDFNRIIDHHGNLNLDFNKLDIDYLSIGFTSLILNNPPINAVPLVINQRSRNVILHYQ